MEATILYILYLHIFFGSIALLTGAIAIFSENGKRLHRTSGNLYFWAMTLVFMTGITVAGYRFNRFLFLIAFISYYSVFAGVRFLKLKRLQYGQNPKWYDWAAGIINGEMNIQFVSMGIYYLFQTNHPDAALLSIGFGIGGLVVSYVNLKPFIVRPQSAHYWYTAHIGNMMGGYIATVTAFLSTMVSRFDIMNPFLAFALPSVIGIPILLFWTQKIENSFAKTPRR